MAAERPADGPILTRAVSDVADFRYTRFTASLALVYAAGLL